METEQKNSKQTQEKQSGIEKRNSHLIKWKKGQSGNPNGRPKGSVSIVTALKQKLEEVPEGKEKTYLHYFIEQIMKKTVIEGDVNMMKDVIDRVDGKAPQPMGGTDELPPIKLIVERCAEDDTGDNQD